MNLEYDMSFYRDWIPKINEFTDYVMDFYSEGGLYPIPASREDILLAVAVRIIGRPDFEFQGDTVDRETVRDIMFTARGGL